MASGVGNRARETKRRIQCPESACERPWKAGFGAYMMGAGFLSGQELRAAAPGAGESACMKWR
jgi:hypothetical protein